MCPAPMADFESRRDKARKAVKAAGGDALLVTNFTNVTYLTGFTGDDSYLLLSRDGQVLISDPRYTTQIEEECPGLEMSIRPPGTSMLKAVEQALSAAATKHVAVEGDS